MATVGVKGLTRLCMKQFHVQYLFEYIQQIQQIATAMFCGIQLSAF